MLSHRSRLTDGVLSMMEEKAWWQGLEAAGHTAITVGTGREG